MTTPMLIGVSAPVSSMRTTGFPEMQYPVRRIGQLSGDPSKSFLSISQVQPGSETARIPVLPTGIWRIEIPPIAFMSSRRLGEQTSVLQSLFPSSSWFPCCDAGRPVPPAPSSLPRRHAQCLKAI